MKTEVIAPYAVIDYTWALLQLNTTMKPADYNGRVPIIPASQQPEFTEINKPFLVYAYNEGPTTDLYAIRTGQIAYAVYGPTDREIGNILNVIRTAFEKLDESADNVNRWAANTPFKGLSFTWFSVGIIEGPSPENQEGGRRSGVIMVRWAYIPNYVVSLP